MKNVLLIGIPVAVLAAAGGGTYWYANERAHNLVDTRLADMVASGSYDSAEYETLRVGLTGGINMTNLNMVQGPLNYTLRNISVTNLDYANEMPHHFDLSVNGLRVEPLAFDPSDPQSALLGDMLQRLGTGEDIPLTLSYTHRYDPDNAHQTDSAMGLSVPGFFALDANSVTRNIEMQTLDDLNSADPMLAQQQLMALLQVAEFPSMQVTLQDQGFVEDMIATSAQENGVSPDDFRQLLVSQAQNFYLFLPANAQGFAMSAGAEMAEFLEGGKTLSVSLAPEYGGNIQRLQQEVMGAVFIGDYDKISELLHLEISAD